MPGACALCGPHRVPLALTLVLSTPGLLQGLRRHLRRDAEAGRPPRPGCGRAGEGQAPACLPGTQVSGCWACQGLWVVIKDETWHALTMATPTLTPEPQGPGCANTRLQGELYFPVLRGWSWSRVQGGTAALSEGDTHTAPAGNAGIETWRIGFTRTAGRPPSVPRAWSLLPLPPSPRLGLFAFQHQQEGKSFNTM